MRFNLKKVLSAATTILFLVTISNSIVMTGAEQTVAESAKSSLNVAGSDTNYASYILEHMNAPKPDKEIEIDLLKYTASSDSYAKVVENVGGREGESIQTSDDGFIEWPVDVESEGLYNIAIDYYSDSLTGKGSNIIRSLKIDGDLPFDESISLSFSRVYTNENPIKYDEKGNVVREFSTIGIGHEIRPSQIELSSWMSKDIGDITGYYNKPFQFYLSKGSHKIKLESIREPMTIQKIKIYQIPKMKIYSQIENDYDVNGYKPTSGQDIEIQGENAVLKSDSMIYPISDASSPSTEPSSPNKILLNTIGGNKWQKNEQWVTWDFYAPQSGLYKIGIKARQNIANGQPSFRKLFIDGKIPFAEMNSIKIPYDMQWQMIIPGGAADPYLFYLEQGKHAIKMEVTMSYLSPITLEINKLIAEYTTVYRDILMIVGPTPDLNRDYSFNLLIPEDIEQLMVLSERTRKLYDEFIGISGLSGQQAQQLLNISKLADTMSVKTDRIPKYFATFSSYISSLGALLSDIQRQPLEVDYISIISPDKQFKEVNAGFFKNTYFAIKQFIVSFYTDYSTIGTLKNDAVKVWIGNGATGGRDQANVLNSMISNYFTSKENIDVNLQLVPMNSLLTATLAKKGPDVALTVSQSEPMNYAIRGAVIDLSQFENYSEVAKRFAPSAMTPLTFENKVFGLPETQNYMMLFYRTDIMEELNLTVPETWEDVITMIPTLEKRNLQFGLPLPFYANIVGVGIIPYAMFLMQNGGDLYKNGGKESAFDSTAANRAFYRWTRFYTDYGLPPVYDATTRFRTGEVPILCADYSFYNVISVAAPELNGKWNFALVPGTKQKDGSVNKTVPSSVNACIILNNAKNKQDAWKFISWWTSADIQEKFGREVESIMGPAARYQTANMEALYKIPWNTRDYNLLIQGRDLTKGIPEVPGSYMTSRYLDFAVKQVVIPKAASARDVTANIIDPGQIIADAAKLISAEIKVRREEFGLAN
ncbi:MAG: extracellular solute-binding protein [Saccharofermentanales bacterium]